MKNIFIIFSLLLCTSLSGQESNTVQETSGMQDILNEIANDATFSQAHTGICVMDSDGQILAEINSDKMMLPASNMKLITTGTALHILGPDYTFETSLAYDGIIED